MSTSRASRCRAGDECVIEVRIDSVRLGSGQWYVNMGVGELGLYERDGHQVLHDRFRVVPHAGGASRAARHVRTKVDTFGCFFIHPAQVTVRRRGERHGEPN